MAKLITFTAGARTPATPHVVYGLLADGTTWPVWSPIGSFRLEREGRDGGESVGAVRVFTTGAVHSHEELLELKPDEKLSYTAFAGLPIRAHRADITLTEQGSATVINWYEEFEPKLTGTGWLLRLFLRWFVQRCANGLAAHAGTMA